MPTETLIRVSYWGGWVSAAVAFVYKLAIALGVSPVGLGPSAILPYHFWQSSFLLFVICMATALMAREKAS